MDVSKVEARVAVAFRILRAVVSRHVVIAEAELILICSLLTAVYILPHLKTCHKFDLAYNNMLLSHLCSKTLISIVSLYNNMSDKERE